MSQAMKKANSCLEVTFALAERVLSKFSHALPKMQHYREYIAGIERLNAVPNDADDGANENEKVRSIHSHHGAREYRARTCQLPAFSRRDDYSQANVVLDTWASHENDHYCSKE
jgi:hypothetical protein